MTLESLLVHKDFIGEIIVIDDGSTDGSQQIIRQVLEPLVLNWKLITHTCSQGLASSYNEGIRESQYNYIVTMHQDILLEKEALKKLLEAIQSDDDAVASTHIVIHPKKIWDTYNFWQKAYFSRFVGCEFLGLDGKFDCFRKSALVQIGGFDDKHYRTAGEDGDIVDRLTQVGKIASSTARIIHIHKNSPDFSWKDIWHKQAQYSSAQGALLRNRRIRSVSQFIQAFFREGLLITLFIPILNYFTLFFLGMYTFLFSKNMLRYEWRDPRILLLPFLNVALIFNSTYFSVLGFCRGAQR